MAQFIGSQEVTVTQKYDIVIDSAGGPFQVPGDYLYQAFNQEQKMGIWGLFRVTPAKQVARRRLPGWSRTCDLSVAGGRSVSRSRHPQAESVAGMV